MLAASQTFSLQKLQCILTIRNIVEADHFFAKTAKEREFYSP
jgi:hypothetical protein